jgi:hypothetical protein
MMHTSSGTSRRAKKSASEPVSPPSSTIQSLHINTFMGRYRSSCYRSRLDPTLQMREGVGVNGRMGLQASASAYAVHVLQQSVCKYHHRLDLPCHSHRQASPPIVHALDLGPDAAELARSGLASRHQTGHLSASANSHVSLRVCRDLHP